MTVNYKASGAVKPYDTTHTVAAPAGLAVNDIVFINTYSGAANGAPVWPAEFTQIDLLSNSTSRFGLAYHRVTSLTVAPSGYTVSTLVAGQNITAQAHAYSGIITTGAPYSQIDTDVAASGASAVPSLASVDANKKLLLLGGSSSTNAQSLPGIFNLRGSTTQRIILGDAAQPTTGAATYTITSTGIGRATAGFLLELTEDPAGTTPLGHVIIGGVKKEIVVASVIFNGVKEPLTPYVVVGGIKKPLV